MKKTKRRKSNSGIRKRHRLPRAKRKREPEFLLYRHEVSAEAAPDVSPANAIRAYDLLRSNKVVRNIRSDPSGPMGCCYHNVEVRVSRKGGELTNGWIISEDTLPTGRNSPPLVLHQLVAHTVWRDPQGRLLDVTACPPWSKRLGFIVDGKLTHPACQSIDFVDSLEAARDLMTSMYRAYHFYLISTSDGRIQDLGVQCQEPVVFDDPEELAVCQEMLRKAGFDCVEVP
jgi:hypothetical protein